MGLPKRRGVTFRVAAVAGIDASELGNIGVWIDVTLGGTHRLFHVLDLDTPWIVHVLMGVASHQRRVFCISSRKRPTPTRPATAECDAPPGGRGFIVDNSFKIHQSVQTIGAEEDLLDVREPRRPNQRQPPNSSVRPFAVSAYIIRRAKGEARGSTRRFQARYSPGRARALLWI